MKQIIAPAKHWRPVKLWIVYRQFVENAMQPPLSVRQTARDYIPNRLFTTGILYGLPIGLLALIPSAFLEWQNGDYQLALFDIIALTTVTAIALCKSVSMQLRKSLIAIAVVITAIVLIARIGSFSVGCTYLMTYSIFFALHFSDRLAYRMLMINAAICLCFALVIGLRLFDVKLLHRVSIDQWIIESVNFLFLNLLMIILIRQTISRLERTMSKESEIHHELKKELGEKQGLYDSLRESESQYKTLFYLSPSAKLIFDIETLCFLRVNKAAVRTYGFSEAEFLSMKLTDIHAPEQVDELLKQTIAGDVNNDVLPSIYTTHKHKRGTSIHVELLRGNMDFRGKPAHMIVSNDITGQVEQLNAISNQNNKLREIAHIQSHEVRLPLTNIMALTELIREEFGAQGDHKLLDYLSQSAGELDAIIRKVVSDSSEVLTKHDNGSGTQLSS